VKKLIFIALMALSAATAQPQPQGYDQLEERDPTGQFVIGKATADEVKAKLGAPFAENRNRDGRFAYVYLSPTNDYTSYLFDKTGVLTQVRSVPKAD
jgi:hypothetical protein